MLHTPDPAAATRFYGAMFGWRPEPMAEGAAITVWRLDGHASGAPGSPLPDTAVAVMTAIAPGEPTPPHWNVNLLVNDVNGVAEHVRALGGRVPFGLVDTPGMRSAALLDPQGAAFSVSQIVP